MTAKARNSAYDIVTIYHADGTPFETSRLNALDLTNNGRAFWSKKGAEPAKEPAIEPAKELAPEEPVKAFEPANEPDTEEADEGKDGDIEFLDDEALLIAGYTSSEEYLATFSQAALKAMLETRYGEKVHGRTGKDKMIAKIIELEASAQ